MCRTRRYQLPLPLLAPKLTLPRSPLPRSSFSTSVQIFERNPTTVKNYGIWVRYQSRTGYHNAYKVGGRLAGWLAAAGNCWSDCWQGRSVCVAAVVVDEASTPVPGSNAASCAARAAVLSTSQPCPSCPCPCP